MKETIIFLIISFFSYKESFSNHVKIINNTKFNSFGFFLNDEFLENKTNHDFVSNNANEYIIETEEPILVTFTKGNFTSTPLLLIPGETCIVEFDGIDYVFTSSNKSRDFLTLINLERLFGFTFLDYSGITVTNKTNLDYIFNQHKEKYKLRLNFISNFHSNESNNLIEFNYLNQSIKFKYLSAILFPYYQRETSDQFKYSLIPKKYDDLVIHETRGLELNDSLLYIDNYKLFIWNYCRFLTKEYLGTDTEFKELMNTAFTKFHGDTKDFLICFIIKKYNLNAIIGHEKSVDFYLNNIQSQLYKNLIQKYIAENSIDLSVLNSEELVENLENEKVKFKEIINSSNGKLIFIDFWASWCAPCLQEAPKAVELESRLRNEKIVFIYISIDKDREKWKNAINSNFDVNSRHYLLNSTSEILKDLKINSIPRYVLLDKTGKIINPYSTRPSEPNTVIMIRRFLN